MGKNNHNIIHNKIIYISNLTKIDIHHYYILSVTYCIINT